MTKDRPSIANSSALKNDHIPSYPHTRGLCGEEQFVARVSHSWLTWEAMNPQQKHCVYRSCKILCIPHIKLVLLKLFKASCSTFSTGWTTRETCWTAIICIFSLYYIIVNSQYSTSIDPTVLAAIVPGEAWNKINVVSHSDNVVRWMISPVFTKAGGRTCLSWWWKSNQNSSQTKWKCDSLEKKRVSWHHWRTWV